MNGSLLYGGQEVLQANLPIANPLRMDPAEQMDVRQNLVRVLETGPLIGGEWVEKFEREFAAWLVHDGQCAHVVSVGSGSDALVLGLVALRLPADSHVLVPANDGGFAAQAVVAAGHYAVPVDINRESLLVSLDTLEAAKTKKTRALIVSHLHGEPVPLRDIDAWRRECGLLLIEDCAQAHGAESDGVPVGMFGEVATFSFYPTKNLGALGDGGAVVFSDAEVASRATQLRNYGWGDRFRVETEGGRNSRLDALQAAVLSARLPYLAANNRRRREILSGYREALCGTQIRLIGDGPGAVAHHAVIMSDHRDVLARQLRAQQIDTAIHYPWLITEMPGLSSHCLASELPVADICRHEILTLPCFPAMTTVEITRVVNALNSCASIL